MEHPSTNVLFLLPSTLGVKLCSKQTKVDVYEIHSCAKQTHSNFTIVKIKYIIYLISYDGRFRVFIEFLLQMEHTIFFIIVDDASYTCIRLKSFIIMTE